MLDVHRFIAHRSALASAVTLALSGFAVSASAQQPMLEEVVVTAQKRAESLQDVPIAITAFGAEDIQRLNSANLSDLQYSTPNLTISPQNRSNLRLGLRGVSDSSRNPGYDNRVSVYVDGIFVGRSAASNQATLDLERIEVLRGPQGTLFGKNTVAGAISLTTSKPENEFGGFVRAEVGNYGRQAITAKIEGGLGSEQLSGKLLINDTQRDGHVDNLFDGTELNGLDDRSIRAQLRWQGESTEINLAYDQDERKAQFHGREAVNDRAAPPIYQVSFNAGSLQDQETRGISLIIDHELSSGMTLSSLTAYRETEFQNSADEDYSPLDISSSALNEDSDHWTQEFRLLSAENESYDWVVGAFFLDQTNESTSVAYGGALFPNPNTSVSVPATVDVTAWALYAHGNYRFSPQWELTAGIRYTSEDKDVAFESIDTTGLFTSGSYDDSLSATDLSPMVGLNWFASDDVMFYAKYARGFKSGGWNVDFVRTFEQLAFDDEQVDSYELGMKSDFWDGRGRLNVTAYLSDYTDFQVFQFVPLSNGGTVLTLTNAGEVTAQGFEVDLNIAATNWLTLWATYGYTDATFDRFEDAGGPGVDYDGNVLPDAPENAWSLGMEVNTPIGDNLEFIGSLDYAWRDDFYTNGNNSAATFVEAYDIVNGRMGVRTTDGTWEAFVWGRNLADSNDAIYASRAFLGINRQTYLDPRMYGVNVTYNF